MKGHWVETYSGIEFNLLHPTPAMICLEDIAHHLSNLCRFNGACKRFFSVSEHSFWGSCFTDSSNRIISMFFLFHDAAEAYYGDISGPLKKRLGRKYTNLENHCQKIIYEKFVGRLPTEKEQQKIKQIDNIMLAIEVERLISSQGKSWECLKEHESKENHSCFWGDLAYWPPNTAKQRFLMRHDILRAIL